MPETGEQGQRFEPDSFQPGRGGHFRRNLGKYTILVLSMAGAGGYYISSQDSRDKNDPIIAEEPTQTFEGRPLPGVTFEEAVAGTQSPLPQFPEALTNYDLSRIIDNEYAPGDNSVERITIAAERCVSPNGLSISATPTSRILFRNSEDAKRVVEKVSLTPEHVEDTEPFRTNFRKETVRSGFVGVNPLPLPSRTKNQIYAEVSEDVCGSRDARMINPRVGSQQVLVDQAAYENRPRYEDDKLINVDWNKVGIGLGIGVLLVAVGGAAIIGVRRAKSPRNWDQEGQEEFEESKNQEEQKQHSSEDK